MEWCKSNFQGLFLSGGKLNYFYLVPMLFGNFNVNLLAIAHGKRFKLWLRPERTLLQFRSLMTKWMNFSIVLRKKCLNEYCCVVSFSYLFCLSLLRK